MGILFVNLSALDSMKTFAGKFSGKKTCTLNLSVNDKLLPIYASVNVNTNRQSGVAVARSGVYKIKEF